MKYKYVYNIMCSTKEKQSEPWALPPQEYDFWSFVFSNEQILSELRGFCKERFSTKYRYIAVETTMPGSKNWNYMKKYIEDQNLDIELVNYS